MNPLLLPLVASQGWAARSRIEVLPEATGPYCGRTSGPSGSALRLTVLGESTAAGCGVHTHDHGFAGAFARALARRHDRAVCWTAHGRSGATIRLTRETLLPNLPARADYTALLIGANDVLSRTRLQKWRDDLTAVVQYLSITSSRVIVAGVPPFDSFPSLPKTLRHYLHERGKRLDAISRAVCVEHPRVAWITSRSLAVGPDFFARDGFHPSARGYEHWAQVLEQELHQSQKSPCWAASSAPRR